ncbi:acyl carrier protein [Corynebacterium urinipleomorphum]|uniref:acyl carrier protein n=1 Tax=Corynebacterium urinipleomorphum TaxID=1852380 RepID=UPI000B36004E|nr:acyl carrier protein [Corynebacterium urinipleomorphum]
MELSQRLDLAKLGLDPDLVPDGESYGDSGNAADGNSAAGGAADIAGGTGAGGTGAGGTGAGGALAQLAGLLAKVGVVEDAGEVETGDTFGSLGVDSLTRIELAVRAEEHFGVRVDESVLDPSATIGEMAQFFSEQSRGEAPAED